MVVSSSSSTTNDPTEQARNRVQHARKRLIAGNLVSQGAPEFGALSANLTVVPSDSHALMATDGTSLYFNPRSVLAQPEEALVFTWAHETLHCALRHMFRKPEWCDWHEWNVCADYAINAMLVPMAAQYGWKVPQIDGHDILYDAKYENMSAEQIAHARRKEREQKAQEQQDDTGSGADGSGDSGSSSSGDLGSEGPSNGSASSDGDTSDTDSEEDRNDGEQVDDANNDRRVGDNRGADAGDGDDLDGRNSTEGESASGRDTPGLARDDESDQGQVEGDGTLEPGDDLRPAPVPSPQDSDSDSDDSTQGAQDAQPQAPEHEPLDEDFWQKAVDQTARVSRKAGFMSAGFERAIEQTRPTGVDWRAYMREFVETVVPSRLSWARPNKRHIGRGIYLPNSRRENKPPIVVCVDTSGSITRDDLSVFADQMDVIWRECKPRAMHVVYHDVGVQRVDTFLQGQDEDVTFEAIGGGGTEFEPTIQYILSCVETGEWEAPAAIVWLTDGEAWSAYSDPNIPVLWALIPGSRVEPSFGDVVHLS